MDNWIARFRAAKTIMGMGPVVIPGDPERASEEHRTKNGIPLNDKVVADLQQLAVHLQVVFPG